jgi:hypothetical protein
MSLSRLLGEWCTYQQEIPADIRSPTARRSTPPGVATHSPKLARRSSTSSPTSLKGTALRSHSLFDSLTVGTTYRDQQHLGELESVNSGKGVRIARDFDIGDTIGCLRYYAGWAGKVTGETIEVSSKTKMVYTTLDPIGVCGQGEGGKALRAEGLD